MLRFFFFTSVFLVVCVGSVSLITPTSTLSVLTQQSASISESVHGIIERDFHIPHTDISMQDEQGVSLLFVGDIMLGRHVEERISATSLDYPYIYIADFIKNADIAIGNLEGVVPNVHIPTPDFGFQFSFQSSYVAHLANIGFDVLSLANNHSNDFGEAALNNTRALCVEQKLHCYGSYDAVDNFSKGVLVVGETHIGMVMINAVPTYPSRDTVQHLLDELIPESDIQILNIHWGEEYQLVHNRAQEEFAHTMIDMGFDAVIGHHPHVVQDVEVYKNAPIFYSLGNFIFDQYFEPEVMRGLMVEMRIEPQQVTYNLIPVTSEQSHSQPQPMTEDEKDIFLSRVMGNYLESLYYDHKEGVLVVPRARE